MIVSFEGVLCALRRCRRAVWGSVEGAAGDIADVVNGRRQVVQRRKPLAGRREHAGDAELTRVYLSLASAIKPQAGASEPGVSEKDDRAPRLEPFTATDASLRLRPNSESSGLGPWVTCVISTPLLLYMWYALQR